MIKLTIGYMLHALNVLLGFYKYRYCREWDRELNGLLDRFETGEVARVGVYTFEINGVEVWMGIRFYSYGCLYSIDGDSAPEGARFRPKYKTMLRVESLVGGIDDQEGESELSSFLERHGRAKQ